MPPLLPACGRGLEPFSATIEHARFLRCRDSVEFGFNVYVSAPLMDRHCVQLTVNFSGAVQRSWARGGHVGAVSQLHSGRRL